MNRSLFALVLLTGCASMPESQCRVDDWYAQGWHDALMGNRPRIELYADQCSRYAVRPSGEDYMAGWNLGYAEWNRRVSRGHL